MTPNNKKQLLAAGWVVAILAMALVLSVGSLTAWLMVSVVAFGPSIVLLHFWRDESLTTSQRIQEARR